MASSLTLKIDALDERGGPALDAKLATTLSDYLQPQSKLSLHDAAQSILAQLPSDKPYSDEGWSFAYLIVEVAEQIPYSHPSHARLVRLLKYLTKSPKVVSRSTIKGQEELCHNFQNLGEQLRDNFQGPEAEDSPLEWVNYHAFLAQLEATGVWAARLPSFAVWEMRDAFEEEPQGQIHQYHIMAAAQWILWDGQEIFKYMSNPLPVGDDEARIWRLGGRCSSSSVGVVSLARWQLWKEGFKKAAATEGGEGSHECKNLAERAAVLMDVIEKSMSF